MNIELEDFYAALRDCVRFYPDSGSKCLRLNGFRVLQFDGATELTNDNMGATACDKAKPYFYSRDWEKSSWNANKVIGSLPVLTAFERRGIAKNPFDKQATRTYQILLCVWDKYDQDKCTGGCSGCEARTVNEIFRDTQIMLFNVLYYLSGVVLATTSIDPAKRVYHIKMLDAMKTNGDITSYQTVQMLKNSMNIANKEYQIYRQETISGQLFGSAIEVTINSSDCLSTEFDFSPADYGIISQEAGCKNC